MSKKILKGDELQLFIGNGAPKWATAHSVTLTGNTLDRNTKDDGFWGASSIGKITWELTAECLYSDGDYDNMFDMMISREKFLLKFARVRNYDVNGLTEVGGHVNAWMPDVKGKQGYATITSLTANANTGENATYSVTFTGAGPLSEYDNTITDYSIKVVYNDDIEGMQLFNMAAAPYINSGWVSDGTSTEQIDISDGKLHDATPSRSHFFIYYLSGPAIPEYMFYGLNTITSVETTNNIYNVGQHAFENSSINEVTMQGPTPINYGNNCFANCNWLTHVNYSSRNDVNYLSAKHINNSAFLNCVRLGNINCGDACEYILFSAFDGCLEMRTVWFGSSLRRVNERAFLIDSHATTKTFHFYTEKAPNCGELAFGNVGYQTFILHNSSDVRYFIYDTDMETLYPVDQCDYQIAS